MGEKKKGDTNYQETNLLESSLKVLKVLHYLCRNVNMFSSQGIKFLINNSLNNKDEEELKEDGF